MDLPIIKAATAERRPKERLLPSWLDEFVQFTEYANAPRIHRKWAALTTISSVLQRKVYMIVQGRQLFPNLFTLLVGPPSVGKTLSILLVKACLKKLPQMSLSPSKLTKERLFENLQKAQRVISIAGRPSTVTPYAAYITELNTFIQPHDSDFLIQLTDLFDCLDDWEYETMTRSTRFVNMYFTLLAGVTPKAMAQNIGSEAFGTGFASRLNIIFSDDIRPVDIFGQATTPNFSHLETGLKQIQQLSGPVVVEIGLQAELQEYISAGLPPTPNDPRFYDYNGRRPINFLKLLTLYSVSESNSLVVTREHFMKAKETLLEAELAMPKALAYMGANQIMESISALHAWLLETYKSTGPVSLQIIRRHLLNDVSAQHLNATLTTLVEAGYIAIKDGMVTPLKITP